MKLVIVLLGFLVISGQAMCSGFRIKPIDIRPIEVTVVDEVTKEPVPDIVLYCYVESVYRKSFLGIPQPIEVYYRGLAAGRYKTDLQGRVYIPSQRVWTKLFHERVNSIFLSVNFDIEEPPETIDPDRLNKLTRDFICNDRWGGLRFNSKYKTVFYGGYFAEEDEYEEGDPKEGELIYPLTEKPILLKRLVNIGSKFGDVKRITIELPRKGNGSV